MEHENDPPAPPLSSCLGLAAPLWTWQPLLADTRGADGHHHHEQDQGDGDEAQLRNGCHEQDENDLEIGSSRLNLPKHQKYQQIYTTAITIGMRRFILITTRCLLYQPYQLQLAGLEERLESLGDGSSGPGNLRPRYLGYFWGVLVFNTK